MRIAITANTAWYVLNFRSNLIRSLQAAGHRVYVIAPRDEYSEELERLGIVFFHLGLSQRGKGLARECLSILALRRIVKQIQPDVVLSFTVKCNLYAGLCGRLLACKQIANISGLGEAFGSRGLLHRIVSGLYKICMKDTRTIFCQNATDLQTLVESGLVPASRCRLIPGSGVDLKRYTPAPLLSENTPRRFLMFGRLVPQKGYEQLLRVAEDLNARPTRPAEIWIMGIEDGSRKESGLLLKRILQLHRKGVITYISPRDDVRRVLHDVDIVVLPSQYNEGVPRSLLEAMACGKPVITTDWRGCRETVEHGVNGYLVKPGDWNDLKQRMLELATCSPETLKSMGEASRRIAEDKFNEELVISAYMEEIARVGKTVEEGKLGPAVECVASSKHGA